MQVGTYPTRNFATLGPLWLQPPFTRIYINKLKAHLISPWSTGQASDPILHKNILQSPVFLINSRYPLFCFTNFRFPLVGTSSPEVTKSFCRVPSILLSLRLNILYLNTCVGFNTVYNIQSFF